MASTTYVPVVEVPTPSTVMEESGSPQNTSTTTLTTINVENSKLTSSSNSQMSGMKVDGTDAKGEVRVLEDGFRVEAREIIRYDFKFIDHVFDVSKPDLANYYMVWGRCLAIVDSNVSELYGDEMRKYFSHYKLDFELHSMEMNEKVKTMDTMLAMEDKLAEFGLLRKEPVLVVGGGLISDVGGFACAAYKRNSNFIRIPTTVIGLIDASIAIKVAVNHKKLKNRLGAYHAPLMTFLDFTFLRTLPEAQIRNGIAELIKIATVGESRTFDLLEKFGPQLITTRFGQLPNASDDVKQGAKEICYRGIKKMLELESPNLHEIMLDRVIAFGHTWSPWLELTPAVPLRHGHAVNIDMAYSTTLALTRGYITQQEWQRIITTMSQVGLALDHELLTPELMKKGSKAIIQTRDGLLRAAVPRPLGECFFVNDLEDQELEATLSKHKELVKQFPRAGAGIEVHIDDFDVVTNA